MPGVDSPMQKAHARCGRAANGLDGRRSLLASVDRSCSKRAVVMHARGRKKQKDRRGSMPKKIACSGKTARGFLDLTARTKLTNSMYL